MAFKVTINIIPDSEANSITKSQNYRIFTQMDSISYATSFEGFSEDVVYDGNLENYVFRQVRYSTDRYNWSLWYDFTPNNLTNLQNIVLDPERTLYLDIKYTYNNGTDHILENPFVINSVSFLINTTKVQPNKADSFTPSTSSTVEKSPEFQQAQKDAFQPYQVGSLVDVQIALSLQTNLMFGHQVVYFRTAPDTTAGDFVFKEWTLFNTIERKCVKIIVPNNEFPDNKPQFADFGVDFVAPFEVQIDNQYFQQMFGRNAEPRVRDFMYIPLMNRMYEIKSVYLYRGLLYQPIYWKIQLVKYQQHSDTKLRKEDRAVLANLISDAETLFAPEVNADVKNETAPKQFTSISHYQDEMRERINRDLKIKTANEMYNYNPLIQYYYDLSSINSVPFTYTLDESIADMTSQTIDDYPNVIKADQNSQIYNAWRIGYLNTYDLNIDGTESAYIKIAGPNNTYNETYGRQIVISAYSSMNLTQSNQVSIKFTPATTILPATVTLKGRDAAVIYKADAAQSVKNMTLAALFKIAPKTNNQTFTLLKGYDNTSKTGVKLIANYVGNQLTITLVLNDKAYAFSPVTVAIDTWHSIIVPFSSEYGQAAFYLYRFSQDPANVKNWDGLISVTKQIKKITPQTNVNVDSKFELVSGPYSIANIRVFNTMLQEEDHEYMVSQQYLTDESMFVLVDNCKPRLSVPFISVNV